MINVRNVQPAAGKPGTPFTASLCIDNRRVATIKASKTGVAFHFTDPAAEPKVQDTAKRFKQTPGDWVTAEAERARIEAALRKRMFKVMRSKNLFFVDGKPHTTPCTPAAAAAFRKEHGGAEQVGVDMTPEQGLDLYVAHLAPTKATAARIDLTTGAGKTAKATPRAARARKPTTKAPTTPKPAKPPQKAAQATGKPKTRIPADVPRTPSGQKSRAKKYRVGA